MDRPQPPQTTGSPRRAQRQDAVTEGSVDPFHDNMILRFTSAGKFIMQIGKPGTAKGGNDIENLQSGRQDLSIPKPMGSTSPVSTATTW